MRVIGDFEGCSDGLPMQPHGDGWWTAEANLGSGEYRFRYRADGEWFPDYASHGVECGKTGYNSVLLVPGVSEQDKASENKSLQTNAKLVA